jgi:XRE family transcriptional regulator, master regulator for biofilm formation
MIGSNIFKIRKKRGISLSELSDRAKISKSYLSNIERNLNQNPSIQILEKIAAVLNVELRELIKADGKNGDFHFEKEWIDFIQDLKNTGIHKEEIHEYKTLIEFIKWKKATKDLNNKSDLVRVEED